MRRYLAFSERAAESAGLEPQHYQLLLMLRGLTPHGGASVSDLADWLQIRHHSAVGLVDRIEARSLVQRRPDPLDGRRVLVVLTRHGRSALRSLAVLHRNELRRLAPDLVDALQQLSTGPDPSSVQNADQRLHPETENVTRCPIQMQASSPSRTYLDQM